jgi:predicted DsbA family dithiol-disulfide isomerase
MNVKVTLYIDVTSSWCYWAQPAWEELKRRYAESVEFNWKIALMDASGIPASRAQLEWFYRRSGVVMHSPYMLNSGWFEPGCAEYLAPNLIAEAARDFGVTDDRVRLALAEAALRDGRKIGQWEEAAAIAAKASELGILSLLARAQLPEVEARARASTKEFKALQIDQRPAFLIQNPIGDRAIFSGIVTIRPLAATIDAMLHDVASYGSFKAHFGDPPPG